MGGFLSLAWNTRYSINRYRRARLIIRAAIQRWIELSYLVIAIFVFAFGIWDDVCVCVFLYIFVNGIGVLCFG